MHRYIPQLRPAFNAAPVRTWTYAEAPPDIAHLRRDVPASRHRHGVVLVEEKLSPEDAAAFSWKYDGPHHEPAAPEKICER